MTPRRRRPGGSSSGGDGGPGTTRRPSGTGGPGGNGVDVDTDGIDTMAGRLQNTGGRVDAVGTTLDGVNVGPQSMGLIGSGFTGAAQTHVQTARQHVTRTRQAVDQAQQGTTATAQTYRDTDTTNAQNLGGLGTDTTPPTTNPAGTTTPAGTTHTPVGTTPGSISAALDGTAGTAGGGTPSQAGPIRTPRRRRPLNRPADAAELRDNRPSIRKKTKFAVYKNSQRAANGNIICPSTGEEIPVKRNADGTPQLFDERGRRDPNGFTVPVDNPQSGQGDANYHFGHVPDSEYHRLTQMIDDHPGRWSHQQVLDEYNTATHYQIEAPAANVGHSHESNAPGYGHYQGMQNLPQTAVPIPPTNPPAPPANPPANSTPTGPTQQPPRIRRR